jgi:CHAT domain-containing protein
VTAWPHAPFQISRGKSESSSQAAVATLDFSQELRQSRTASNLRRYALAKLATGSAAEASALLAEASKLQPDDATILSDLAAAQLASGHTEDAAETTATVLQRDPEHAAAAFNWALALETLSNRPAAVTAWQKYLAIDTAGGWADEAREHLTRLRVPRPDWQRDSKLLIAGTDPAAVRRVVETFPHRTRNWIHDVWLPRYLERKDSRDLILGRMIAAVRADAGDLFLQDFLDHLASSKFDKTLRDGLAAFASGRTFGEKHESDAAAGAFRNASLLLHRANCPLALIADISAATNDFYRGKSDDVLARLDTLDAELAALRNRYPEIAAESRWSRALVYARLGRSNDSLKAYESGIDIARGCGEIEDEVAMTALMAAVLDRVGDPAEAERYRRQALRRLDETGAGDQRAYNAYSYTAYTELAAHRPRLALAFIETQSNIAAREKDPLLLAETEAARGLALRDVARNEEAMRSLSTARRHAQSIPTAALKDRVSSDIAYVEGTMLGVSPEQSVAALGTAIDTWHRYGWRIRSATGLLARGEAYLRAGNRPLAETDFRAGIEEMEEQRGGLQEPQLRVAYFEHAESLFEALITLLLDENRPVDALSVAERKRARLLLDRISSAEGTTATIGQPLNGASIAAAIPAGAMVVEYALLDRSIAIWTIADGRVGFVRVETPRDAVDAAVRKHVDAVHKDDLQAVRANGRWLFDRLLAPVARQLNGARTAVIVADGSLNHLPFATLTTANGRYLIEEQPLMVAPSASSFIDLDKLPSQSGPALVVAQPAPADATPLPAAAGEARQEARAYPNSVLRIGTAVTPKGFLDLARHASMILFSGHAVADEHRGSHSALLFESAQPGESKRLEAGAIAACRLRAHPLVVLAGCGTARGTMRSNEGMESLATAFLNAGARAVVATMWDVDDRASSSFFVAFHANRRRGQSPAEALRTAQRAMLTSNDPSERMPAVWGAPVLIGSM